jgi:hypothetical protein
MVKKVSIPDPEPEIIEEEEPEDNEIEVAPEPVLRQRKKETKPRPPKTAAQLATVQFMLEAKRRNTELRKEQRERLATIEKEELEERVVKKALAIKKKQVKRIQKIEELSDDDDDVEEIIRHIRNKKKQTPVPGPPVYQAPTYRFI